MFLLCRGAVFLPCFLLKKKSLVCQKDEARREMSLSWLRIIVLKALFKLLLTKLKHLACGTCVPTCRLKGMHEDGWYPGWGWRWGSGREKKAQPLCCPGCRGCPGRFLSCSSSAGQGCGKKTTFWSMSLCWRHSAKANISMPITQALKYKSIQDLSL